MVPFKNGFFCADLSIRYPYRECTITVPMLLILVLLLPMLGIAVVEIVRIYNNFRTQKLIRNVAYSWGLFSFGFIATYLTTEIAKHVVGRLRPHFYTACQPKMPDGNSCEDVAYHQFGDTVTNGHGVNSGLIGVNGLASGDSFLGPGSILATGFYVEQYYCGNRNLSMNQIKELHVSFPSAHSSLSFYSMVFLVFYLHHVWQAARGNCRVLRHILQFLLLLPAWFISLSRVADYWHHWSDVLAGALMGVGYAILTTVYVGGMLQQKYHNHTILVTPPTTVCSDQSIMHTNECNIQST